MAKNAQHSVHSNPGNERRGWCGGSRRVFEQFVWLGANSVKAVLSRLATSPHQGATRRVPRKEHMEQAVHRYFFTKLSYTSTICFVIFSQA